MIKKILSFLTVAVMTIIVATGCNANQSAENSNNDDGKISIIATLFPQYDFAKHIAGDKANVKLLLPVGVESHSYEPTPSDIVNINKSDMFIYTGEYMEGWASDIIKGVSDKTYVLDVSKGITLYKEEDEHNEEHNDEDEHEDHDHGGYDPHIWTSPENAIKMVENIEETLCEQDPDNADYYKANAEEYLNQIQEVDNEFKDVVKNAKRTEIFFGGRFAMYYFAQEYGLTYTAAFDSCSDETEPSAKVMADIISRMKEQNIPVIYYEELTDPKVAKSIADETGAKALLLHSCHNVTKQEMNDGATYVSLMKQNIENLKLGLN